MHKAALRPALDKISIAAYYIKEPKTGCWIWIGKITNRGYGVTAEGTHAHRYVYWLYNGKKNTKLDHHHKCHVKLCVNPAHIKLLSRKKHLTRHRKLSLKKAKLIRVLYNEERFTLRELAQLFKVNISTIHSVITFKTWVTP